MAHPAQRKTHRAQGPACFSDTLQDTEERGNIGLRNHTVCDAVRIFEHALDPVFECLSDKRVHIGTAQGEKIERVVIQAYADYVRTEL